LTLTARQNAVNTFVEGNIDRQCKDVTILRNVYEKRNEEKSKQDYYYKEIFCLPLQDLINLMFIINLDIVL